MFSDYQPASGYDEAFNADGTARQLYERALELFGDLSTAELKRLQGVVEDTFRRQGITFTVYGDDEGTERAWPMDLMPRLVAAAEWRDLANGLAQRVTALNRFLTDVYSGQQEAIGAGVVPGWLVTSSDGFERNAFGLAVPFGSHCTIAGIDVVRGADGAYMVLEDNLRNPSGISYVVENRAAMVKALPQLFVDYAVQPVDHYARMLRETLESMAPPAAGDTPMIVVHTPGIFNSAYFEHAFLARAMGVELVEGQDLVVDEHVVYARTIEGLVPVDVIYRRIDDAFLDPVSFSGDTTLGVAGLLGALRAGSVTVCNAIGNGVADDKAIYPYVPSLIRYYLDEEPLLAQVPTYVMWDDDQRAEALARLGDLVAKPVAGSGGYGVMIGPEAAPEQLAETAQAIADDPRGWIVQDVVNLSSLACVDGDAAEPRHLDLRPFILSGEKVEVFPGGLTRVSASRNSLIVNSSQGGGSKDTWVLDDDAPTLGGFESSGWVRQQQWWNR